MAEHALRCLLLPFGWSVRVLDHPRYCPADGLLVSYGEAVPTDVRAPHLHIPASDFFGPGFGSASSVPGGPLAWDDDLPVLFPAGGPEAVPVSGRIVAGHDLLAGAFFLLTGYEEAVLHGKNAEGRLLALHALAGREGFVDWPVIEVMRDRLVGWLTALGCQVGRLQPWSSSFGLALTHDISHLLPAGPINRWRQRRRRAATPRSHLEAWLATERQAGIQATYFVPLRTTRTTWPISRRFREAAASLAHAGHEIGGLLPRTRPSRRHHGPLIEQHPHDGKTLRGARQAGWRWDAASMPAELAGHGFDYDCSLGFPDRPSFRAGTTWPFPLFDLGARRSVDVWAIPLLCAGHAWLQQDTEAVFRALRRFGGLMALDWSDSLSGDDVGYDRLIGGLQEADVALGSIEHLLSGFLATLPTDVLERR
jgi:peptidoglycan/xylan/chitin deacetylase (PgdA/CDA1 family)